MTAIIQVTFSSAAYDEDVVYVIEDSRRVRRAIALRRQIEEATGDGHTEVKNVTKRGEINATEFEFIEYVMLDVSDGYHDDEARAWINEVDHG